MPLLPIHLDEALLVLNKPAGLLCVPGRGADKQDCLIARAQTQWSDALTVHRLDMATSGLVIMGRGPASQRRLSACFEQRLTDKVYTAVVHGDVLSNTGADSGVIEAPLAVDWPNRPRSKVCALTGKPSTTHWRIVSQADTPHGPVTRLALKPITGRTHQLRVHLMHIGHPIVGDALYAPDPSHSGRLLLHAQSLSLPHPTHGQTLHFESPCPF